MKISQNPFRIDGKTGKKGELCRWCLTELAWRGVPDTFHKIRRLSSHLSPRNSLHEF